jgi:hypothetical protein
MKPLVYGVLLVLSSQSAWSEVAPFLQHKQLGAIITNVKYPEALPKELKSGLTNRVLIRVTLLAGAQILAQKAVDVTIKYDLWDEKFLVTKNSSDVAAASSTYSTVEEVMAYLASLKLSDVFVIAGLERAKEIRLMAELLVNPIERERMDRIRKWVTENSAYTPMSAAGGTGPATAARSNDLFNKIFEQYSTGAEVAAAWKQVESSRPFKLQDLTDEK